MTESEDELKSLSMRVKEESKRADLKLNNKTPEDNVQRSLEDTDRLGVSTFNFL